MHLIFTPKGGTEVSIVSLEYNAATFIHRLNTKRITGERQRFLRYIFYLCIQGRNNHPTYPHIVGRSNECGDPSDKLRGPESSIRAERGLIQEKAHYPMQRHYMHYVGFELRYITYKIILIRLKHALTVREN